MSVNELMDFPISRRFIFAEHDFKESKNVFFFPSKFRCSKFRSDNELYNIRMEKYVVFLYTKFVSHVMCDQTVNW